MLSLRPTDADAIEPLMPLALPLNSIVYTLPIPKMYWTLILTAITAVILRMTMDMFIIIERSASKEIGYQSKHLITIRHIYWNER
jgi:hypothetical protein